MPDSVASENITAMYQFFGVVATAIAVALYALYRYLLPKPIPGIPYNPSALRSLFGDIPAMIKNCNNSPIRWMVSQSQRHSTPVFQLFITPFSKPSVIVSDFREAQDILMRRKEFDRSDWSIALLGGEAPKFHINLKMGPEWKGHRRLLQDLMTPRFLNSVAGPNIYSSAACLVELWAVKSYVANGQPFSAAKDIYFAAFDAVIDFGFGECSPHRALTPQLELVRAMDKQAVQQARELAGASEPVDFAVARLHDSIESFLAAGDLVEEIGKSGFMSFAWWWKRLQPRERRHKAARTKFLREQAFHAIEKLKKEADEDSETWVKSAVDLIMQRERIFARKEGRDPVYWSHVIRDELFGFVMAGHDTTSTTLCWGLKFLAECQRSQARLRQDLWAAHSKALAEKRAPTYEEISMTKIPYLDAVIEEMLRLSHTAPAIDRQCTQDTMILGHHIPAGTQVFLPNLGPSFTSPPLKINENLRHETSQLAAKEKGARLWPLEDMDVFWPERWLVRDRKKGEEWANNTVRSGD
ncbi:cytochrome p450 [Colletotrichum incanum]|uniref:Cytochrome p450 n=1 Tax=Colletotrichum incanum TaxID=1573173 RepID=A0A167CVL7_COLIC|nr:cytochrome p450 [Colletotrichum incanum]OHW90543.1 cytochrome p450 [Colletotrichum incanum]